MKKKAKPMGTISGGLKPMVEYALSDTDIRKILGNDISIITYPELAKIQNIDEIFDNKGRCVLLYLTSSPNCGHWCCLLRKKRGIEFYDPYGEPPDTQFNEKTRDELGEPEDYLTELLEKSGTPYFYNKHQYQKDKAGVNSCGRWSCCRLIYGNKSDKYFKKVVEKANEHGMTNDEFITALTANFLGK